jgi:hypothetical protein
MSVIMGTANVPGNATVAVYSLPPGYANVCTYQPSNPQAVYKGTSANVSVANGLMVPVTPMNTETYTGSRGATIYATTGNATASSFCYIISTTGLA